MGSVVIVSLGVSVDWLIEKCEEGRGVLEGLIQDLAGEGVQANEREGKEKLLELRLNMLKVFIYCSFL